MSYKNFLTDNKIYFETATAAFLSLAGLALSFMAVMVSCKANSIAEEAAKVSKLSELPSISAWFRLEKNSQGGNRTETLVIKNSGDVMFEFTSYPFAFLSLRELNLITPGSTPGDKKLKKADVPLLHYFPTISYTGFVTKDEDDSNLAAGSKGIISLTTVSNTNQLNDVLGSFSAETKLNDKVTAGNIDRYLKVTYTDKFSDKHVQYYRFDPFGASVPISEEEGEALLSTYDNLAKKSGSHAEYDNTTKADLERIWQQNASYSWF